MDVSDEEYYYDESDVEVDDVDDEYYDDAASDSNKDHNYYTILKEEDIRKRQDENITEISTVLQISKEAACLVLRGYNWSVCKVHEEWYANEEKVRNAIGIIVEETPKERLIPGNKRIKCGICLEKVSCKNQTCAGCGHLYCNLCWKGYIKTSINDGPGCLTLRCPEPSCAVAIGGDMINKFATDEDKKKYNRFIRRTYVENSRTIKWCPAPGCDLAVEFVIGSERYDVICDCSYGFCWNCKEEAHRPVDCETVGKWILKNSSEAENTSWILANCKPCPKCKRSIEKNQGCNHMTCDQACKFEFCWICLGDWSTHKGDSYSCNQYEEANKAGAYDEQERKREMAKRSLERYAHYYERWASNNSARHKALEAMDRMRTVHFKKLIDVQVTTETQLKFILEAWEQIVECRRVLKWSYAYGYYLREEENVKKTQFFEYLQGEAESGLERLHHCAEIELMKCVELDIQSGDYNGFRTKLIDLTTITRNYFENLVRGLHNGLLD